MKQIFFFFLLWFSAIESKADIGCLSSSTTYTYINEEPLAVRNDHYANATPSSERAGHANRTFYHRVEADRNITASNFCTTPISPLTPCQIHSTRSGYTSSPGTIVTYSQVDNCNVAIDDHLPFLFVSLGVLSVYLIRQKVLLA